MATKSVASGMSNIGVTIKSLSPLCRRRDWMTDDPLGLGGLLFDACRLCQLFSPDNHDDVDLCEALLDACSYGLGRFVRVRPLAEAASNRLAFRELGLAIGLKAVPAIVATKSRNAAVISKKEMICGEPSICSSSMCQWVMRLSAHGYPMQNSRHKVGKDTRT